MSFRKQNKELFLAMYKAEMGIELRSKLVSGTKFQSLLQSQGGIIIYSSSPFNN